MSDCLASKVEGGKWKRNGVEGKSSGKWWKRVNDLVKNLHIHGGDAACPVESIMLTSRRHESHQYSTSVHARIHSAANVL